MTSSTPRRRAAPSVGLLCLLDVRRPSRTHGAFEHHLGDAIALNRERAPRYAALTGGASRRISFALVTAERVLLPLARAFDAAAAPWRRAGIPLLEALFVPMSDAPPFAAHRPCTRRAMHHRSRGAWATRRDVARAFRAQSFAGAATALETQLVALASAPEVDAMSRHLLESAYRIAALAPGFIAQSDSTGLPSPAPLLGRLLRLHLWGLPAASLLDRWARPLQERGIAIIAQDVPPIPVAATHDLAQRMHALPTA